MLEALSALARQRTVALVLAILTLSAVVWTSYQQILPLGFTGWDTVPLMEWSQRNLSHSVTKLVTETLLPQLPYYRPLSNVSFALDLKLWGLQPLFYHLEDIFVHWANCLGLLVFGFQATRRLVVGWFAALLLALHPVFGIVIANISYRQDVLVTLALVWGLVFTNQFFKAHSWRRFFWYSAAVLAFIAALGFKEIGIIALPLTLGVITYQNQRHYTRGIVQALPFLGVTAAYALLHLYATPPNLVPTSDTTAYNFALPLLYLQSLLVPNPVLGALTGFVLLAVCAAIVFLLAQDGQNSLIRRRSNLPCVAAVLTARRFWILLWCVWILLALLVYVTTNFQEFVERYAYSVAAPLLLLLSTALFTQGTSRAPAIHYINRAAQIVLLASIILWLPLAPLWGLPQNWVAREQTTLAYLDELDRIIKDLPEGTTLELQNVPPKWMYINSIKSWMALKWADKKIRIVQQTSARKPAGQPSLAIQASSDSQHVVIQATYSSTEE